jgi:hypothetical protein
MLLAFGTYVAIWYILVNCVKKNLATLGILHSFDIETKRLRLTRVVKPDLFFDVFLEKKL